MDEDRRGPYCKDRPQAAERLTAIIEGLMALVGKRLPDDVRARLEELRSREDSPLGREVYAAMFTNLDMAEALDRPCCQDTGIIQFFVRAGTAFPLLGELEDCLKEALIRATRSVPLRPNVVEFFDEKNTGNNTGTRIPWVDWELIPGLDSIQLFAYMAGGGCSLPGFARVLTPLEGYEGVYRALFDQIIAYGVNACPPLLVGLGLGNSADTAARLSKKALLRFIGVRNPHPRAAEMEERLEGALNKVGIGPGGLLGNHSVMAVHIEQAGRHTATFAMGLSTGCWAHRRGLVEIQKDLSCRVLSHGGAVL
ncbi:MAG: L(+)-tartrate dehydratase subunit alpha [Spirochaetaceae bacterium]|jgi:L(+)-tartrate dehydratase alpha subunit|nr:L(+)-tartrate dehydratase subunit alpha [Spirochaetaceae bacterium]